MDHLSPLTRCRQSCAYRGSSTGMDVVDRLWDHWESPCGVVVVVAFAVVRHSIDNHQPSHMQVDEHHDRPNSYP